MRIFRLLIQVLHKLQETGVPRTFSTNLPKEVGIIVVIKDTYRSKNQYKQY